MMNRKQKSLSVEGDTKQELIQSWGGRVDSRSPNREKGEIPYTLHSGAFTTMVPRKLLMMLEARGEVLKEVSLKEQ